MNRKAVPGNVTRAFNLWNPQWGAPTECIESDSSGGTRLVGRYGSRVGLGRESAKVRWKVGERQPFECRKCKCRPSDIIFLLIWCWLKMNHNRKSGSCLHSLLLSIWSFQVPLERIQKPTFATKMNTPCLTMWRNFRRSEMEPANYTFATHCRCLGWWRGGSSGKGCWMPLPS